MRATWVVASFVLAAAGLAGYYAVRATSWAVMTDELQVVRLAESIADRLSPVPYIHGVYYGALSQLYPLLIAPFFGLMSAPTAATAVHALNAVLLPSAAWPAYLLARSVTGSRAAGAAAAALTAFTPWLVLTSTLLTENAAYPAFVWAVLLCYRALTAPSRRRDLAALGGLALAFFARTQFIVLAVALPAAVLCHETGFAFVRGAAGTRASSVRSALRRAVATHPVLAAAYGLGVAVAAALAAVGSLGAVVGNYAVPFSGDLFPPGLWGATASHLGHVVVGCGVLPFLLAAGWAGAAVVRPERREAHAFAMLLMTLVPLLTIQVASFDLRFTPGAFNQDRYLFYLAPLFAVGCVAALAQRTSLRLRAVFHAAAFGLFVWLLQFAAYDDTIIFWAAPAAAFHPALASAGGWLHVSAEALVAGSAAVLLTAVVVLLARLPRAALPAATAVVAAFGVLQAVYVNERYAHPAMTRSQHVAALPRDWIDRAVPDGSSVALVPSPHDIPDLWWEAELWNKKVDRLLRVGDGRTFSPFPANDLSVNFSKGVLRGPQPSRFLLLSSKETRFHPLEEARLVDRKVLRLVRVRRPYRLAWATRGLTPDGWTTVGRPATLRFYGNGVGGRRDVAVVLSASSRAALPLDFTLRSDGSVQRGWVDPGGARPPLRLSLCVSAHGFVDLTLSTQAFVHIPDGRLVGLHIDRIDVQPAGACDSRQVSSR